MRRILGRAAAHLARGIGLWLALVAAANCADEVATTFTGEGLGLAGGGTLQYRLSWNWDGAAYSESDKAWVFTTDLGYEVGLEEGYLATQSLGLYPCIPVAPTTALGRVFGGRAYASHAINVDPSTVVAARIESIRDGTSELGVTQLPERGYCQCEYFVAAIDGTSAPGFELATQSAWVKGWWRAPGGERHAFETSLVLPGGNISNLVDGGDVAEPLRDAAGRVVAARVTLERRPAKAFDGIVFEDESAVEIAYAFLQGVSYSSVARWER